MTSIFIGNDYDGIMLLHKAFQRAGGWCEPVPMEEKQSHSRVDSAKNESIRVVEYGCPVIGFGLHWSPRVTDCRETSVSKVVPRIVYSSLRLLSFKDFFCFHKNAPRGSQGHGQGIFCFANAPRARVCKQTLDRK